MNQTLTNTQQAPPLVQSSFLFPIKSASNINQFKSGGTYFIKAKITKSVKMALKLLELKFLFILSNNLFPLNSILIKYKPIAPNISGAIKLIFSGKKRSQIEIQYAIQNNIN